MAELNIFIQSALNPLQFESVYKNAFFDNIICKIFRSGGKTELPFGVGWKHIIKNNVNKKFQLIYKQFGLGQCLEE